MGLTKNTKPGTATANAYLTRNGAISNPRTIRAASLSPMRQQSGLESVGSLAVQFILRTYGTIDTRTLYLVAKGEGAPPWPLPEVMERCNLAPKTDAEIEQLRDTVRSLVAILHGDDRKYVAEIVASAIAELGAPS